LEVGLTVIGALSIDTIKASGRTEKNIFGGSAGYASIAASFFTNVNLVSNIGTDYPPEFIEILKKRNINIQGVRRIEGLSSHFEVCYDDELCTPTYETIELNVLNDRIVIPDFARNTKYVYLATNDPEIQLTLIEKLSSAQIVATDTHSTWIEKKYDCVKTVMERVDIMFMDDTEVCLFGRKHRLRNAASEILKLGVSKLVVKKREHGAILFADNKMYPAIGYDTYDMNVIDPTGYGGTIAGGFIGVLADDEMREEKLNNIYLKALAFALVVASFKIEDFSILNLLRITKEDIWRRYDRFRDMLSL
jgi:sugar/nucleoside kinase (ribokinase family)